MRTSPAPLQHAPATPGGELALAPAPRARPRPRLGTGVALAAVFAVAAAYHALQSRGHLTPAIFTDELLHSKLAQSIAAGRGLEIRGEPYFFPAPLPALLQAPFWLLGPTPAVYGVLKVVNALVMAAACFPAYWLARQLVRPRLALVAAAASVAAPALLYHSYLLSEALAYPVFLLALAVMTRSLARPSTAAGLAVVGVSLLAVTTRTQFAALPVAYVVAIVACRRREWRRHALPAGGLAALGALALLSGGAAFGPYLGAALLDYSPLSIARFGGLTAALLAFSAGWLVVPGALVGLAYLAARPLGRADAPFAALTLALGILFVGESGLIAALEAERPLERYSFYLVPLVFVAFLAYAERGAPARRVYAALALAGGVAAWLMPFPSLADFLFSFDSPTLSVYGDLAARLGHANAATIMSGGAFAGSIALAVLALRRGAPAAIAAVAAAVLVLASLPAYAADRAMTQRTLRTWAGSPADWLDRSGLGRADFLALPGSSPHFGWTLEAWNRDVDRVYRLGVGDSFNDSFPAYRAQIDRDGLLLVDGRPTAAGLLVVNDYTTQLGLEGTLLKRPRAGLSLYRVPARARVRSLAIGLFADGWASTRLRYQVWPERPGAGGTYRLVLELPRGYEARRVTVSVDRGPTRSIVLEPGQRVVANVPAPGYPVPVLRLTSHRSNFAGGGTPNPRLIGIRVPVLEYVCTCAPAAPREPDRQTF